MNGKVSLLEKCVTLLGNVDYAREVDDQCDNQYDDHYGNIDLSDFP